MTDDLSQQKFGNDGLEFTSSDKSALPVDVEMEVSWHSAGSCGQLAKHRLGGMNGAKVSAG